MADIAAEAHVSVKTVSRVVNHEPGVRPDTAERVRAVIERVGFRRGDGASTLRQGRTFTIGLVVEDLADPFYSHISAAVEREARIHRYLLVTASAEGSPTRERSVLKGLVARRVDGLIVVPAGETPIADPTVISSRTPVVTSTGPCAARQRSTRSCRTTSAGSGARSSTSSHTGTGGSASSATRLTCGRLASAARAS